MTEAEILRTAFNRCNRHQIDLALVDLQLPDCDCYTVLRQLDQMQKNVISIVTPAIGNNSGAVGKGPRLYPQKRSTRSDRPPHRGDLPQTQHRKLPETAYQAARMGYLCEDKS